MNQAMHSEFKSYICAMPSTDVAIGLVLLACKRKDAKLFAATAVYFSRDYGTDYLSSWLIDEVEPLLTASQCRWMWEKGMKFQSNKSELKEK